MPDRFPIPSFILTRREREPFFAEALPCECCGEPCESLEFNEKCGCLTGTACSCMIPEIEITCPGMQAIYASELPRTIGELNAEIHAHESICPQCGPPVARKEVASERDVHEHRRTA